MCLLRSLARDSRSVAVTYNHLEGNFCNAAKMELTPVLLSNWHRRYELRGVCQLTNTLSPCSSCL